MFADAQSNPLEVDREFGDNESHDAYGETPPVMLALKLPSLVKKAFISLILKDHVVHYHISRNHLSHGLNALFSGWVLGNSTPRLEHTK
jgi:hypothetical protein